MVRSRRGRPRAFPASAVAVVVEQVDVRTGEDEKEAKWDYHCSPLPLARMPIGYSAISPSAVFF